MFELTTLAPDSKDLGQVSGVQARLLTFDGENTVLADPGWDGLTDLSFLDSVVSKIDLILLSQTTVEYLGAFAYLLYKYPILKEVKTYATLPVAKLGRLSTTELYRSVGLIGAVQGSIMEVTDIEAYFNSIVPLNYAQSVSLQGKLSGTTITAYNSGHTLGGAVWSFNREAEKVVYAPVWNHSKDLFLKPCKLLNQSALARPTTFVTGSDFGSSLTHRKRVDTFLQLIDLTLSNGTSVFLPTTLSGRFFEMLPLLDQHVPRDIPFYLVAYTGLQSLKNSSNMLEWMSPDITKGWENQNSTPFDATRIQLVTLNQLRKLGQAGPKVVFVEALGFNAGSLARSALVELCSRQNTALFLTERPSPNTTLYDLYKTWETTAETNGNLKDGSLIICQNDVSLEETKEVPLRGQELNKYLKEVDERREKRKQLELEERQNDDLLDNLIGDDDNNGDSDDEKEEQDEDVKASDDMTTSNALTRTRTSAEDTHITVIDLLEMPIDFDLRGVRGSKNRMFPYMVDRFTADDYGIEINHDDFKREEEKFSLKHGMDDDNGHQNKRRRHNLIEDDDQPQRQRERPVTLYNMDSKSDPVARSTKTVRVKIRCGLTFIDLSGLCDMRSWKFNANGLKPRKAILLPAHTESDYIGGSTDLMESLMKQQKSKLTDDTFHTQSASGALGTDYMRCKLNEKIDLGNVISSYSLQIDDGFDKDLKWQQITGGYSLSHISGEIVKLTEDKRNLFKLVGSNRNITTAANKISIGDVKLNELRHRLKESNHIVEFKGDGTLVVDNQLAVRKISDGQLVLDGVPSELFYEVRKVVQSMLAYV